MLRVFVRSFQHYTLVSGLLVLAQSFIIAFDFISNYTWYGVKSIVGMQLQPDRVSYSETMPQKSKTTGIKTRKNLLHLKMLSTFQDWPAAGPVTTGGKVEQNRCAKNVYATEYFIPVYSFVSRAFFFSFGIFSALPLSYCIFFLDFVSAYICVRGGSVARAYSIYSVWVRGMHMRSRGNDIYVKGMICAVCSLLFPFY